MNRARSFPWGFIFLSLMLLLIVGGIGLSFIDAVMGGGKAGASASRVALIEVSGAISDEGASGALGGSTQGARDVIESLDEARLDPTVKAVVIRVNSPGGSASASQEMYQAVKRVGKPVVCSMGDLAASGGYYVAAACDTIYANGSTLTGSIGVISQFLNYQGLFKKLGLDEATIKSGRFKDAGNPARPLTPAERQLFQAMIMNVYEQFVSDVAQGRKKKLTLAQVRKLADGRVYTGKQAFDNKLIDKLGGLHEAVREAARLGGIKGEPQVKNFSTGRGLLGGLLGAETNAGISSEIGSVGNSVGHAAGQAFAETMIRQLKQESSSAAPQAR
jgi:protease-4